MNKRKTALILLAIFFMSLWPSIPQAALLEGSLVKAANSSKIYLITKGQKHWLVNQKVFDSYPGLRKENIKIVNQDTLDKYPRVKHVKLADDDKVYYITGAGLKRHILNPRVFFSYGNKWKDVIDISQTELNQYQDCQTIRLNNGLQVYKLENNQKRWVKTAKIFNRLKYDWSKICPVNQIELDAYYTADPILGSVAEQRIYPQTIIIAKPEAIAETTEVTFKYSGTNPLGDKRNLTFETYLEGYDKDWTSSGSRFSRRTRSKDSRTFRLPKEPKVYTFYVRAKNEKGRLDPTPASFRFQVGVSPFYGKVVIRKVKAKEKNFEDDYLTIRNNDRQPVNVSGWTIESRKGSVKISQAINDLKSPFTQSDAADIKLSYRDQVVVTTGPSPRGINFRLNQCTGYLDQKKQFCPGLPRDCDRIEKSEYSHLKKPCRDFIRRLGRCQLADYSGNWAVSADSQCTSFLNERFNYSSCYDQHYLEVNFLDNEWRVFLNRQNDLWDNNSDKIILRDKDGLIVDKYTY